MKRISKSLFLFSITSLTALSTSAIAEQVATAPELEGGFTLSIGTIYAAPGSETEPYASVVEESSVTAQDPLYYPTTQYDWGFEASIGYVFDETANGIELSYRGLNSDSNDSVVAQEGSMVILPGWPNPPIGTIVGDEALNQLTTKFNSADLMFSQFLDIGNAVQMRFEAGLAYVNIEQDNTTQILGETSSKTPAEFVEQSHSQYQGWGPRLGMDARYDFGEDLEGFGIVAGGSVGYFFGELDSNNTLKVSVAFSDSTIADIQDNTDNHSVLNLRGNLGVDYVYFFDHEEINSLGIEIGYLADYYQEAISQISTNENDALEGGFDADLVSASFMGPYVNIKGVF